MNNNKTDIIIELLVSFDFYVEGGPKIAVPFHTKLSQRLIDRNMNE